MAQGLCVGNDMNIDGFRRKGKKMGWLEAVAGKDVQLVFVG